MFQVPQIKFVLLPFLLLVVIACALNTPTKIKYKGVCFSAPSNQINENTFDPIVNINANAIAIIPYAFGNQQNHSVVFNTDFQWWGEKDKGVRHCISQAKKQDLKVMLKPHIWFRGGYFHGDYNAGTEENWQQFESDFRDYILHYAQVAADLEVEIYCIATEMKYFAINRPGFWYKLIKEIKTIYKGKLSYAANWDSYSNIIFWDVLDYIGIDAYFPLSPEKSPSTGDLNAAWNPYCQELEIISEKFNKQIIFAEYGYRSIDYNCKEPWDSNRKTGVNLQNQLNAYTSIYQSVFNKDWFAGGFIWKWFSNHEKSGGIENNRFTPQNKPTEALIRIQYQNL
ncbi:MAG: hypothetical protein ACI8ZO_001143 [Flavobacteriales bacterium]